jgi:hypothetical protein
MAEVNGANRLQLGRWFRFLPSPGMDWTDDKDFKEKMISEGLIMEHILVRFDYLGGMDTMLSKQIGWSL